MTTKLVRTCNFLLWYFTHHVFFTYNYIKGNTALIIAARENHKDAVKLLTQSGAQVDIFNYEQMTAADVTMDNEVDAMLRQSSTK